MDIFITYVPRFVYKQLSQTRMRLIIAFVISFLERITFFKLNA